MGKRVSWDNLGQLRIISSLLERTDFVLSLSGPVIGTTFNVVTLTTEATLFARIDACRTGRV